MSGRRRPIRVVVVSLLLVLILLTSVYGRASSRSPDLASRQAAGSPATPNPSAGPRFAAATSEMPLTHRDASRFGSVTATVPVGSEPVCATYDSRDGYVYVVNFGSENVSVIKGTSLVATIPVGALPECATYDADNGYVYVANTGSNSVSVINGSSAITSLRVDYQPLSSVYDPLDGYLYVANLGTSNDSLNGTGNITVIHGTSVVGAIAVSYPPSQIVYDDSNGYVYALSVIPGLCGLLCETTGSVAVISGMSLVGTVSVGNWPSLLTYDGGAGDVYVGESVPTGLSVINDTSVIADIPVNSSSSLFPSGGVYDSFNGDLYVSLIDYGSSGSGSVLVVRGSSILAQIPVGNQTFQGVYDSGNAVVYEPNWASNNVSVIENSSLVATLPVGSEPSIPTYDSANGYVYVPNNGSDNVSVIAPPALQANFTEGGALVGTCQPPSVTVSLLGSASGGDPPYRLFTWSFGVGYPLSYGSDVNHTFNLTGVFNITLTVTDSAGVNASVTQPVTVPPPPACPPIELAEAPPSSAWVELCLILGAVAIGFVAMAVVVWKGGRQGRNPPASPSQ